MFCTSCGSAIPQGQAVCPQCGQLLANVAQPATPAPSMALPLQYYELERYRSHIKVLGIVWIVLGALTLLGAIVGLILVHHFLRNDPAMGMFHNLPPWVLPAVMRFGWLIVVMRALLAFAAGWGLIENERWGKIVAIIAAVINLIHFPFGTAMGIWTLVLLLGYRNAMLYEQL